MGLEERDVPLLVEEGSQGKLGSVGAHVVRTEGVREEDDDVRATPTPRTGARLTGEEPDHVTGDMIDAPSL